MKPDRSELFYIYATGLFEDSAHVRQYFKQALEKHHQNNPDEVSKKELQTLHDHMALIKKHDQALPPADVAMYTTIIKTYDRYTEIFPRLSQSTIGDIIQSVRQIQESSPHDNLKPLVSSKITSFGYQLTNIAIDFGTEKDADKLVSGDIEQILETLLPKIGISVQDKSYQKLPVGVIAESAGNTWESQADPYEMIESIQNLQNVIEAHKPLFLECILEAKNQTPKKFEIIDEAFCMQYNLSPSDLDAILLPVDDTSGIVAAATRLKENGTENGKTFHDEPAQVITHDKLAKKRKEKIGGK